jgi:hypothetical protein
MGATIRVIFNSLDTASYAIFFPLEIDNAVMLFMSPTTVPHRDSTSAVSTATPRLGFD